MGDIDRATGGRQAPRPAVWGVLRRFGLIVVVGALVVLAAWAVNLLPSDTDRGSVIVRAAVGLGIGLLVIWVVRRVLVSLTQPPPPPPPQVDARSVDVVYECVVCGTRLRLEVAATGKAPRHCGEEMESLVEPL